MANRFWIFSGSSIWNNNAVWSTSTGGAGGASYPVAGDNAIFDSNSGSISGIYIQDEDAECDDITFTGVTGTPPLRVATGKSLIINGSFTGASNVVPEQAGTIRFNPSTTETFTSDGMSFTQTIVIDDLGASGTITLQDNLTTIVAIVLKRGTFNTNGKTVTCARFFSSYTSTRTLTLGASTINCGGDWDITTSTNLTINANTSTIDMTADDAIFIGGVKTYNDVTFTGDNQRVQKQNTYNVLTFTAGKTIIVHNAQTFTTLTATGSSGNLISIQSSGGSASPINFTKSGGGTVTLDYVDLTGIAASGGTFNPGDNSIDSGGNSGWTQPWTDRIKAFSSNEEWATHISPSGKLYVKLSKDAGTTWTSAILVTHTGTEDSQTFGSGTTELWGTTWTGADVDDASFRVRVYANASDSFNTADYYDFAFDGEIAQGKTVTGIKVITEAKWDGSTTSLDHINVTVYGGDSPLEIAEGSFSHDSTNRVPTFYDGTEGEWVNLMANRQGWTLIGGTFTYASSTTITVDSGAASKYSIGDKLRFQNNDSGTYLYAYIISMTDTILTIVGDTVPNATLTDVYYSKASSPLGFSHWFDWTTVFGGFSADPTNVMHRFRIDGREATLAIRQATAGTSDDSGFTMTLPIVAATVANANWVGYGMIKNNGTTQGTPGQIVIVSGSSILTVYTNWAQAGFNNINAKQLTIGSIRYEI